jgi:hypothetical protein
VDPTSNEEENNKTNNIIKENLKDTVSSFTDSKILQTYSNAFHVKKGLTFEIIYNVIKEGIYQLKKGRRMNSNLYQSLQFYLAANLFYFFIQLLGT